MNTILLKLFQKTEGEETFPNAFKEGKIALLSKPGKVNTRKLQTNIPDEYQCKSPQQNTSKQNSIVH